VPKTILACVAVALIVGATSATAASLITSADIKNGTIQASDIRRGAISESRLARDVRQTLRSVGKVGPAGKDGATVYGPKGDRGPEGPQGRTGQTGRDGTGTQGAQGAQGLKGDKGDPGLGGLESDGPYPGATDLGNLGTNGSEGDNSSETWPGDNGAALHRSWVMCPAGKTAIGGGFSRADEAPADFAKLNIVSSQPTQIRDGALVYEPIAGDAAGSFVPNAWLVEGFNEGSVALIVRPHVVCARIG
jgi:hypothetical protein